MMLLFETLLFLVLAKQYGLLTKLCHQGSFVIMKLSPFSKPGESFVRLRGLVWLQGHGSVMKAGELFALLTELQCTELNWLIEDTNCTVPYCTFKTSGAGGAGSARFVNHQ